MDTAVSNADRMWVSILNWNGVDDTLQCLAGFAAQPHPRMQVAVWDNGSREDPSSAIGARFPHVECHRSPVNLGFTGGHNAMIRIALERGYGSVFILNNDCEIGLRDVEALQQAMDADASVAVLSSLIYRSGEQRRALMVTGSIDWAQHRSLRPSDPNAPVPAGQPLLLVGTALLLRSNAIRQIGPLDDRYFAYHDDNDLSARLHAAGLKAAYCHESICLHDYKALHEHSAMALYLLSRNQWLFWREHTPAAHRRGMTRHLLAESLALIAHLQHHAAPLEKIHAVVDGWWDARHGRFGPPPAQRTSPWWLRRLAGVAPYLLSELLRHPWQWCQTKLRLRPAA